jgi:hypothetical protein
MCLDDGNVSYLKKEGGFLEILGVVSEFSVGRKR